MINLATVFGTSVLLVTSSASCRFLGTDLKADYRSRWLFPMFAQRVLNPQRPDYSHWRDVLNLPADATPFESMARSEGHREGDAVLVTAPP